MNWYLSRTMCDVLQEMRTCYETRNFCALLGLIEEAQVMANRMESGLSDKHSVEELRDEIKNLKKQKKKLEKED